MADTVIKFQINPNPDPVNAPDNTSSDYQAMSNYWLMIDDILAGADAIRAKGEQYLNRFFNENLEANRDPYRERLQNAPFTNLYEDISRNLAAKPFAKECQLVEDANQVYKDIADNIDGQGNNLHVFAQQVFHSAVDYALSWIMVDYTRAQPRADGQVLSIAEEKAQGQRPYWVFIPATRMLAVYSDFIAGEEIITHARIYEPFITLDGYLERTVERIRVLKRDPIEFDGAGKAIGYGPPYWELWESITKTENTNETTWVLVDAGFFNPVDVIPIVPFVTGVRDPQSWRVRPPLRGIAHMQIQEYNQESNLKQVMELTCFPMLSGDGITPQEGVRVPVGPRAVLYGGSSADGRPGSWHFIEPGAQSITALSNQLEKTQNQMRDLGMQPLTMQNLTVITTGQVAVKANSTVQAWAIKFQDALEEAWWLTAKWLGREADAPEVNVFKDFNTVLDTGQAWTAVWAMRLNKDVSQRTAITTAMRYGYLPDNFDPDQNDEELATESENDMLQGEQTIDPRTGQPIQMNGNGAAPVPGKQKAPPAVLQNQRVTQ